MRARTRLLAARIRVRVPTADTCAPPTSPLDACHARRVAQRGPCVTKARLGAGPIASPNPTRSAQSASCFPTVDSVGLPVDVYIGPPVSRARRPPAAHPQLRARSYARFLGSSQNRATQLRAKPSGVSARGERPCPGRRALQQPSRQGAIALLCPTATAARTPTHDITLVPVSVATSARARPSATCREARLATSTARLIPIPPQSRASVSLSLSLSHCTPHGAHPRTPA